MGRQQAKPDGEALLVSAGAHFFCIAVSTFLKHFSISSADSSPVSRRDTCKRKEPEAERRLYSKGRLWRMKRGGDSVTRVSRTVKENDERQ